jgi:hypothetical protein
MKNLAFTQYHLWEWCGKGYRLKKKKEKQKKRQRVPDFTRLTV